MSNNLSQIFLEDIPLIDVRANCEYITGHFPTSVNLPILTDTEREKVGICYKEKGQEEAVTLGETLVSGENQKNKIDSWINFIKKNKNAKLYCARGGMRSKYAASWIKDAGFEIERIEGGYKKLRNYLLSVIDLASLDQDFLVLGGLTGSGKTTLIHKLKNPYIDLESLANHKGSSFGRMGVQPDQASFENSLAVEILKKKTKEKIIIEDESNLIGDRLIPKNIFTKFKASPLVIVEVPVDTRVQNIISDYIGRFNHDEEFFINALGRIQKKLGGLNYKKIKEEITYGFKTNDHALWIKSLLTLYYDPLYMNLLKKNEERILFRGNFEDVLNFMQKV